MRTLFIHAEYVNYEVEEKTPVAEEINADERSIEVKNPLIAFISVEEMDEKSSTEDDLVRKAMGEIEDIASKIGVKNIVLFPFAHLSNSLASPEFAISMFNKLDTELQKEEFNSYKVPFGWYKEFEFKSKGHPLSVLSRTIQN